VISSSTCGNCDTVCCSCKGIAKACADCRDARRSHLAAIRLTRARGGRRCLAWAETAIAALTAAVWIAVPRSSKMPGSLIVSCTAADDDDVLAQWGGRHCIRYYSEHVDLHSPHG